MMATPVVKGQALPAGGNRWTSGYCNCTADWCSCCAVFFCGPITTAQLFTKTFGSSFATVPPQALCLAVAAFLFLGMWASGQTKLVTTGKMCDIDSTGEYCETTHT